MIPGYTERKSVSGTVLCRLDDLRNGDYRRTDTSCKEVITMIFADLDFSNLDNFYFLVYLVCIISSICNVLIGRGWRMKARVVEEAKADMPRHRGIVDELHVKNIIQGTWILIY